MRWPDRNRSFMFGDQTVSGNKGTTLNMKARAKEENASAPSQGAMSNPIVNGVSEKRMSAIETFGETLPGLLVESVVDPDRPDHLLLHTWNGRRTTTARKVEHGDGSYIPGALSGGLVQWVRFAPPSLPFASTAKIISSLRDFLSTYARLEPAVADLLVAFALASWFCDSRPVAPALYLFGPDNTVSHVLRLLACFCRRPALLGDVDFEGLMTLPNRLGATLLINQRDLGRRVQRALLASNRRHFCIVRGKGRLDLYGAKAFSSAGLLGAEQGLKVSISPTHDSLPLLTDSAEHAIAHDLQARLLRYRMVHYVTVGRREVDCSALVPEMRDEASTWLAPLFDCPELSKAVFAEILRQSRETADTRFFDPECVVAEAALCFCHKPNIAHFFVGELAERVNALLKGRHEESVLSAKRVGLVLRQIGVHGERVAEGYRIVLSDDVRNRIHQVAQGYQVLSLKNDVRRCRYCRGGDAAGPPTQ